MIRVNKELLDFVDHLFRNGKEDGLAQQQFDPHDQIIQQEKIVRSVYIIIEGIAKCYLTEDNGKDFNQEFFGEGELFGELEVIKGSLSICNIEAITALTVYKISDSCFNRLLENNKVFNRLIMKALAEKVSYTAVRAANQQSYSAECTLKKMLKAYPDPTQVFAKQDLANYLGVTLRSLNRMLKKLKENATTKPTS